MKADLLLVLAGLITLAWAFPAQHGVNFVEDARKLSAGARIIDGLPAVNGQFPHQAYLVINTVSGSSVCGGSLISQKWVLTAAYCINNGGSVLVHLGHVRSAHSPVLFRTTTLIPHPDYNQNNLFNNNIGLIELPGLVYETENIKTIALAKDPSKTYEEKIATVTGFGRMANTGPISPVLNYVDVKIISNTQCADTYGNSAIVASTICAVGAENSSQGACNSDSGGPLILEENGVTTLIGIVSFGSTAGCTSPDPNGFVRPSHYVDWINQYTGI